MNYQDAFHNGLSYDDYVNLLGKHLSLHQLHYNKCSIAKDTRAIVKSLKPYKILVITEPWCADSLALLPIVRKMSEINGQWEIKIILRDSSPEMINQFLTDGMRAIPIFLFLNENGDLEFNWGPRPEKAAQIFENYRNQIQDGTIDKKDVIKKIRVYYAKDRGQTSLAELMNILEKQEDLAEIEGR